MNLIIEVPDELIPSLEDIAASRRMSLGPKTDQGKEKSRRNTIKDGERATTLKYLIPPHAALTIYDEEQRNRQQ